MYKFFHFSLNLPLQVATAGKFVGILFRNPPYNRMLENWQILTFFTWIKSKIIISGVSRYWNCGFVNHDWMGSLRTKSWVRTERNCVICYVAGTWPLRGQQPCTIWNRSAQREEQKKYIPSAHSLPFLLMSAYPKMGNAINHAPELRPFISIRWVHCGITVETFANEHPTAASISVGYCKKSQSFSGMPLFFNLLLPGRSDKYLPYNVTF